MMTAANVDPRAMRALKRFEEAAIEYSNRGAQLPPEGMTHQDVVNELFREYRYARKNLLQFLRPKASHKEPV